MRKRIAPGAYIAVELETRKWTGVDLAKRMNVPVRVVERIVVDGKRINAKIAGKLARAFSVPERGIVDIQNQYDRSKCNGGRQ